MLETVGVTGGRVVEVRGYADTKPRVIDDPLASANRRISILLPYTKVNSAEANAADLAASKRDSLVEGMGGKAPRE